jgi:putative salt-induced outer membrane protein
MNMHRTIPFLFVALILSAPALAQDQPPAKPAPPPPPRFEGSAELSLVSAAGNSDTQSFGLGSTITWRPDPWTTNARVSFIRSETDDIETARALIAWLRQGRTLTPRLDVFGRVEYLADEFAGIDNRFTVDGGLGYKIVETAQHLLRADAGLGYAHESRLVGEDLSTALMNLASLYRWKFGESATVENGSLYSLSFDDADDWRFRNAFAVTAAMTRLLSLKLSHEVKYVNAPVEGFEKTDRLLSAAVVAKW